MIYLDTETFSEVPLSNGGYIYAANCEIMIVTYALDRGPVECWDVTRDSRMPDDLAYLLFDTDELICAHSSMFDRTVLRLSRNLKIDIPIPRWRDTLVKALAHSLPGGLDRLCEILEIEQEQRKLKTGKQLIHLFCKPRPKNATHRRATRFTNPNEWQQFIDYAKSDIVAMRTIDAILPNWNYQGFELDLWHLDQRINDKGLFVDLDLTRSAIRAVDRQQRHLAARAVTLTNEEVTSATQRDKLLAHILQDYGIDLPDMQASTLERRVNDPDLPIELRELLAIRLQATTSSTSKYQALMRGVSADGRLRGTKQFCGANRTGRWAGRMFQPDNLPRPKHPQEVIELGIEALKLNAEDLIFDNVMDLAASAIRGCIVAPPGKKLRVADLSNIEGRKQAWYAGEGWKLQAFRDFDAGTGPDLYKLAYAKSFRITPDEVTKPQRQIGKVQELALGYQGGVGAFVTFAVAYAVDLEKMADEGYETIPGDVLEEAEGFYDWFVKEKRSTYGLDRRVFVGCDSFKRMWRMAHPRIEALWGQLEDTVRLAITQPGNTYPCAKFKVRRDGAWLRIVLPSGRACCYPNPRVNEAGQISYMGVNQYTRKWSRIHTYGGKLFENLCQAGARDVMAWNMPSIEQAGYEIVLTVHDEVITEAPDTDAFSDEELSRLLATVPVWAEGLPLSAGGYEAYRYRKE